MTLKEPILIYILVVSSAMVRAENQDVEDVLHKVAYENALQSMLFGNPADDGTPVFPDDPRSTILASSWVFPDSRSLMQNGHRYSVTSGKDADDGEMKRKRGIGGCIFKCLNRQRHTTMSFIQCKSMCHI